MHELAEVWRSIEVPSDPVELERELGKAGIAAAARSTERKRTALPPKVCSVFTARHAVVKQLSCTEMSGRWKRSAHGLLALPFPYQAWCDTYSGILRHFASPARKGFLSLTPLRFTGCRRRGGGSSGCAWTR